MPKFTQANKVLLTLVSIFLLLGLTTLANAAAEIEPNNTSGQANTLTSGVTMFGNLYDDTDEDYFKINVGSSGTLDIQVTSSNFAALQILNPSLQVVGGLAYISGTKSLSVGVGASGNYYVRIFDSTSYNASTDSYDLSVTYNSQVTNSEVEFNNSSGQANSLTSSVVKSGHLYDDTDEDYFKINVGSSGTLDIQVTSSNFAALQILNPSLQVVGGLDYISGTKSLSMGVAASGDYYVRIFDSTSYNASTDSYDLTATYTGDSPVMPTLSLVSKTSTTVSLSMSSNGDGSSPVTQWDTSCEIPSLASRSSRELTGSKVISLGELTNSQPKARGLNTSARTTAASQAKVYLANPELRNAEVGDTLLFAASDGSEISLLIKSVLETSQGNLQIVGNSPTATALAVVNLTGEFFASVETETAEFRSVILGGETLVYSSLDGGISDLPVLHDMDLEALAMRAEVGREGGEPPPPTGALSGSTTVVTVGALYDNLLRDNVDTAAMVDFYVGKAILSYQNSGVDIQFDVVATANYEPYKDTSDLYPTLNWITCGTTSCNPMDGVNTSVNNWRDSVKADVVLQFLAYGATDFLTYIGWGIAQLPFNSSDITNSARLKQHTYSVNGVFNPIDGSVGPSGLVAHEMGHNFGLFHDRDTLSMQGWTGFPAPVYDYAFGHRFGPSYGSVMSYADNPVEFLSNPSYSYSGYPTGVAIGQSGQAHSAEAVANVMGYHAAIYSNAPVVYHAVTVSNGAGGSVSPASASVREGAATSFTLTPESGYAIGSVSGCGGSLSGNIYITGAIYSACSISVSFQRYRWTEATSVAAVTFSGLPTGYTYSCSTVATNLAGSSPASNALSFTFLVPPSAPSNVRADSGDEEIYLYFTAGDNGGSPVTQFTATCTDGTNSFVASSVSSPVIVAGLTNDTSYTCTVTATNEVGTSPVTAPTAPIIPEETVAGLPIWLLYQATQ